MVVGLVWEFVVQILSGIVAVFVGIWLALIVERRRREQDAAEKVSEQKTEFDRVFDDLFESK